MASDIPDRDRLDPPCPVPPSPTRRVVLGRDGLAAPIPLADGAAVEVVNESGGRLVLFVWAAGLDQPDARGDSDGPDS